MTRLGPFVLHTMIGRGGASDVWQGMEEATGHLVAVKIAHEALVSERPCSFLEEARRMAQLHHRGLIQLYDYGLLPPEVEAATSGFLATASPYLVMELAATGLHHYSGQISWPILVRILRAILDALAYIHARDLLHCDLKPGNILMARDLKQVKLSDFGISCHRHELAARYKRRIMLGTPSYMSPEQFNRSWRDYGPWTDLYALGCTAVELFTGTPPFGHCQSLDQIKNAHVFEPFLGLPPSLDAPMGFSIWLSQTLAKDPADRFQCAADARLALDLLAEDLPDLDDGALVEMPRRAMESGAGLLPTLIETQPIHTFSTTSIPASQDKAVPENLLDDGGTSPELWALKTPPPLKRPTAVPPLPTTWPTQVPRRPETASYLTHPGLEIVEQAPLQGRQKEQEVLWSALGEVCQTGHSRFVWLEGATGVGKSRLLQWLQWSVHQTGAAICLTARPAHSPGHSMAAMMMEYLRCGGLQGRALAYQISARMSTRRPQTEESTESMRQTRVTLSQPWSQLIEWLSPFTREVAQSPGQAPATDPAALAAHNTDPAAKAAANTDPAALAAPDPDEPIVTPFTDLGIVSETSPTQPHKTISDSDPALIAAAAQAQESLAMEEFAPACDAFLKALCEQRPVLLCLEDLHAYDDALLDWCHDWCTPPRPYPLLLVGAWTLQEGEVPDHKVLDKVEQETHHHRSIHLAPQPEGTGLSPRADSPQADTPRSKSTREEP